MDAFESLMRKKLWGKYVKPSYIDDEAMLDDKDTLDKKSSEDGDKTDGEESGQLTPPPKSVSNDNEIGAIFILIWRSFFQSGWTLNDSLQPICWRHDLLRAKKDTFCEMEPDH